MNTDCGGKSLLWAQRWIGLLVVVVMMVLACTPAVAQPKMMYVGSDTGIADIMEDIAKRTGATMLRTEGSQPTRSRRSRLTQPKRPRSSTKEGIKLFPALGHRLYVNEDRTLSVDGSDTNEVFPFDNISDLLPPHRQGRGPSSRNRNMFGMYSEQLSSTYKDETLYRALVVTGFDLDHDTPTFGPLPEEDFDLNFVDVLRGCRSKDLQIKRITVAISLTDIDTDAHYDVVFVPVYGDGEGSITQGDLTSFMQSDRLWVEHVDGVPYLKVEAT